MRAFTTFFTLLLALLFTSQVLAGPVLEVSVIDASSQRTMVLTYLLRLVRTLAAPLLPRPRLQSLLVLRHLRLLLQALAVATQLVLEPAHLAPARALQDRTATATLVRMLLQQDMVGLLLLTSVYLVLIVCSCSRKRAERWKLRCCAPCDVRDVLLQ